MQPTDKAPGDYPSGGPQVHVHDIWKAGAPNIDMLAPDIYLPDFPAITTEYQRSGTPLFVPESRAGTEGASNAFFAFGARSAIGYSPFGIESVDSNATKTPVAKAYAVLGQLAPVILDAQSRGALAGIRLGPENPTQTFSINGYALTASLRADRRSGAQAAATGYGIVLSTGENEFIVAGSNIQVTFMAASADKVAGLATVDEGVFANGKWTPGRRLNGDEIMVSYDMAKLAAARQTGTGLRFGSDPSIQRVTLYQYQ